MSESVWAKSDAAASLSARARRFHLANCSFLPLSLFHSGGGGEATSASIFFKVHCQCNGLMLTCTQHVFIGPLSTFHACLVKSKPVLIFKPMYTCLVSPVATLFRPPQYAHCPPVRHPFTWGRPSSSFLPSPDCYAFSNDSNFHAHELSSLHVLHREAQY